jgi:hypothetical protein
MCVKVITNEKENKENFEKEKLIFTIVSTKVFAFN